MRIEIPIAAAQFLLNQKEKKTARAQIYNYDDNQRFDLQFIPMIRTHADDHWAQRPWQGTPYEHAQFLATGQASFEIPIELLVDPGAPKIANQNTTPSVLDGDGLVSIENVRQVILKWAKIRPDVGRPSLVGFTGSSGTLDYAGYMTYRDFEEIDRFPEGRIRHAILRIGITEWKTPSRRV